MAASRLGAPMSPTLLAALGLVAPWTALAALLGLANGALFFLIAGRSAPRLPLYLVCGAAAAALVQPAGALRWGWSPPASTCWPTRRSGCWIRPAPPPEAPRRARGRSEGRRASSGTRW